LFVLTLEPLRFLDFVAGLNQSEPATDWHKNLSRFSSSAMDLKKDFAAGRFVYIPTGGGDYRPADVYGEAIVPPKYLEENWAGKFEILEYVDDPDRFWQAVVVARKPLT
jgi:hypothetical protein